ncbi:MAG TPA: ABC transporter permease [Acidimicrobiia bacterium]|nr:ABC transporter permease [Acidimicrobiia bacterium]
MSSPTLAQRTIPVSAYAGLRAHRVLERNVLVYRRIWKVFVSGFAEPVFYLLAIGVGVGALVGDITLPDGQLVSYTAFVAPALLGASAMNGAIYESTFNIFFKLKYGKIYDAMLATPLRPVDIAVGEISWSLIRGGAYAVGFIVVMLGFGLVESWWAVLAVPAALLIGLAFGSVGMAATSFMRSWQDFDMVQLVSLPLFLFSATFYPLDVYPPVIQQFTRISPLYHGVELIRGLTIGVLDWTMIGHTAFLLAMAAIGMTIAARRLEKLLLT